MSAVPMSSAPKSPSLGSVRISHGVIVTLAFLVVLSVAVVALVTDATTARGAETSSAPTVVMNDPGVDMYTAMADVAAALAALPTPAPINAPQPAPRRPAVFVDPSDPGVWDTLAHCETGGNWATDSVSGFSGGLGFAHGTWASNGGTEFAPIAADATREQQILIAQRVLEGSGWGAWPGCSDLLGLR